MKKHKQLKRDSQLGQVVLELPVALEDLESQLVLVHPEVIENNITSI